MKKISNVLMFAAPLGISSVVLICFLVLAGCQKKQEPTPGTVKKPAPIDVEMQRIDSLYKHALEGDKKSIKGIIISLRHSDGSYSEMLCDDFGDLLVKQTSQTIQVLGEIGRNERKQDMWMCLASEAASPPDNMLDVINKHKSENPEISNEIVKTMDVGKEYMRLYSTKGENAAEQYLKQYLR